TKNRVALLNDLYRSQEEVLRRKQTELDKANKELRQHLEKRGVRDESVLKTETDNWTKKAEAAEQVVGVNEMALEAIKVKIRSLQKRITNLKENKAEVSTVDKQAFQERQHSIQAAIDAEKNNLAEAEKTLSRAENDYKQSEALYKVGS